MGVHRTHRQPRLRYAKPIPQSTQGYSPDTHHQLRGKELRDPTQRNVGRNQHNPQRFRREHHGHVHVAGESGQPLGVSRIPVAGEVEGVLFRRPRHDGIDIAGADELDGLFHRQAGQPTGGFREEGGGRREEALISEPLPPPCSLRPQQAANANPVGVPPNQFVWAYNDEIRPGRRICYNPLDDFRPYPSRIAEGNGNADGHEPNSGCRCKSRSSALRRTAICHSVPQSCYAGYRAFPRTYTHPPRASVGIGSRSISHRRATGW